MFERPKKPGLLISRSILSDLTPIIRNSVVWLMRESNVNMAFVCGNSFIRNQVRKQVMDTYESFPDWYRPKISGSLVHRIGFENHSQFFFQTSGVSLKGLTLENIFLVGVDNKTRKEAFEFYPCVPVHDIEYTRLI